MTKNSLRRTLTVTFSLAMFSIFGTLGLRLMTLDSSLWMRPRKQRDTLGTSYKRAFDIVVSSMGLIAISPLILGIAVVIKLSSPGPVFYCSRRVGRHGRLFGIYKFRTM